MLNIDFAVLTKHQPFFLLREFFSFLWQRKTETSIALCFIYWELKRAKRPSYCHQWNFEILKGPETWVLWGRPSQSWRSGEFWLKGHEPLAAPWEQMLTLSTLRSVYQNCTTKIEIITYAMPLLACSNFCEGWTMPALWFFFSWYCLFFLIVRRFVSVY